MRKEHVNQANWPDAKNQNARTHHQGFGEYERTKREISFIIRMHNMTCDSYERIPVAAN